MFSKTQEARFLLWAACHRWSPSPSMTSASPGWISRSSFGAQVVERARLGCDDPAVLVAPKAQGPHAQGVAAGDQDIGGGDGEAVRPAKPPHGVADALLPITAGGGRDQPRDHLGVGRCLEDNAFFFEAAPQLEGVDDVPVVGQGQRPPRPFDEAGLRVLRPAGTGRRVAGVADREVAGEALKVVFLEGLVHQPHAGVEVEARAVAGRDARALLPAVLEGVDPEEGDAGYVFAGGVDAEDAATLLQTFEHLFLKLRRSRAFGRIEATKERKFSMSQSIQVSREIGREGEARPPSQRRLRRQKKRGRPALGRPRKQPFVECASRRGGRRRSGSCPSRATPVSAPCRHRRRSGSACGRRSRWGG